MKVTVYGMKPFKAVIEIDDAFKILGEDELTGKELWSLEGKVERTIKDKLDDDLEISGVWADDDILLYES